LSTFEDVQSWGVSAVAHRGLLNIFTHDVQYPPRLSLGGCTPDLLVGVLDFLVAEQNAGRLSVMTQRQAYESFDGQKAIVVFSFDDGWVTDYTTAWPLFKARGLAGTSYISGAMVDSGNPDETYMGLNSEMAQGSYPPQLWSVYFGSYPQVGEPPTFRNSYYQDKHKYIVGQTQMPITCLVIGS
jgi:hypothetical protein